MEGVCETCFIVRCKLLKSVHVILKIVTVLITITYLMSLKMSPLTARPLAVIKTTRLMAKRLSASLEFECLVSPRRRRVWSYFKGIKWYGLLYQCFWRRGKWEFEEFRNFHLSNSGGQQFLPAFSFPQKINISISCLRSHVNFSITAKLVSSELLRGIVIGNFELEGSSPRSDFVELHCDSGLETHVDQLDHPLSVPDPTI